MDGEWAAGIFQSWTVCKLVVANSNPEWRELHNESPDQVTAAAHCGLLIGLTCQQLVLSYTNSEWIWVTAIFVLLLVSVQDLSQFHVLCLFCDSSILCQFNTVCQRLLSGMWLFLQDKQRQNKQRKQKQKEFSLFWKGHKLDLRTLNVPSFFAFMVVPLIRTFASFCESNFFYLFNRFYQTYYFVGL